MARTIQDNDLLMWEVYPSGGDHGYATRPYITFNCLTDRLQRPRQLQLEGDEADAEKLIVKSTEKELLELFRRAAPVE